MKALSPPLSSKREPTALKRKPRRTPNTLAPPNGARACAHTQATKTQTTTSRPTAGNPNPLNKPRRWHWKVLVVVGLNPKFKP